MGEAVDQIMGNTMADQHTTTTKERRNGMGNIFEGIDPAVLEKLGLSEDIIHELNAEADTFAVCMSQIAEAVKSAGSVEKSRVHRSFSTTISEEVKMALQHRRRRNAVGNLLELLSSSQQLLLVEHLQEQLERVSIVRVNDNDIDNTNTNDNTNDKDLTSPSACSTVRGPSPGHGQIVCH